MKAWLATQIERIESVPECGYDDSSQHLYVIGPDDQIDFAYAVREAYIRAAKHGYDAPAPDAMLTKSDALYALRPLLAWLDGHEGDKSTPPVDGPLTVKQAAAHLNVSAKTIYAACDASTLRHIRIGERRGTIRIAKSDLDNFMRQSEVAAPRDYLSG